MSTNTTGRYAGCCTTDAIESINTTYRRAVGARGHFPNEQAALFETSSAASAFSRSDLEGRLKSIIAGY